MRSLGLFWFTLVAVAAAIVGALPTKNDYPSVNPDTSTIEPKNIPRSSGSMKPKMTNAQRFRMNLPPLKPKLRRGTRVVSGHKDVTYLQQTRTTATYLVLSARSGLPMENMALYNPPKMLDITAVNGPSASYPFFGAAMGPVSDGASLNLGPGSFNHAFIVGTTQIPAGSTPQAGDNNSFSAASGVATPAESAIWMFDPVTQEITVQWVNPDGSTPPNYIIYYSIDNLAEV
ncbi:hypothetical protein FRC01_013035 [Tulasnella sp. 417]|nr:hypothetical protein FRC01_013035 [Tulasnella sp. 417]